MSGAIYVNGRITAEQDAVVPVLDRGFLFGEGVYEVCRTYGGRPFLLDRHLRRLRSSADLIALPVPFSDEDLAARIDDTMRAAGLLPWREDVEDAYVRIVLTRGLGGISYDPATGATPSLVVIARPHVAPPPTAYDAGVAVRLVSVQRNAPAALNPRIKSNNLLNNALAMQQALACGAVEAIMRNHRGELAEMSQSNLFVVSRGRVRTPPLDAGLLPGITRELVLELCADLGVPTEEATLRDPDLLGADEAFLTSTTKEIVPVVRVDDTPIASGAPGPVTRRLLQELRARISSLQTPNRRI